MNKPTSHFGFLLILYTLFVFYGALFPFKGWHIPTQPIGEIVLYGWLDAIYMFDVIQNLLLFFPFGLFAGCYLFLTKRSRLQTLLLPIIATFLASLCIEIWQTYNPARLPSLLDIILNVISGFLGALFSQKLVGNYPKIQHFIENAMHHGSTRTPWPWIGLSAWIGWGCFQLYPFIPSIHPTHLYEGVYQLYLSLKGENALYPEDFLLYVLQGTTLFLSGKLFLKTQSFVKILLSFTLVILIGKISVIGPTLSLETLLGSFFAIGLCLMGQKLYSSFSQTPPTSIEGGVASLAHEG